MAFMPKPRSSKNSSEDLLVSADDVPQHRYVVLVETGTHKWAGTNEVVRITLYGDRGYSPHPISLVGSDTVETSYRYTRPNTGGSETNNFPVGSSKEFAFSAPYVGNLVKIRVTHGEDNPGNSTSWHCVRIVVKDDSLHRSWAFNTNTWFTASQNDNECEFVHSGDIASGRRASTRMARRRSNTQTDPNLAADGSNVSKLRLKFDLGSDSFRNTDSFMSAPHTNLGEGGVRKVCFQLSYNSATNYDIKEEYMYLFGAIPALGGWDPQKAIKMNMDTGADGTWRGEWRLEIDIDDDYDLIEYQYLQFDEKHKRVMFSDKSHTLKLSEANDAGKVVEGGVIYVRDSYNRSTDKSPFVKELSPTAKNLQTPVKLTDNLPFQPRSAPTAKKKRSSLISPAADRRNSFGFIPKGGSAFLQTEKDTAFLNSPDGTLSPSTPDSLGKNEESTQQLIREISVTERRLSEIQPEIENAKRQLARSATTSSSIQDQSSFNTHNETSPISSDNGTIMSLTEAIHGPEAETEDAKSETPTASSDEEENTSSTRGDRVPMFTPPQYPKGTIITTKDEIQRLKDIASHSQEQSENLKVMLDELRTEFETQSTAYEARQAEFVRVTMDLKESRAAEKRALTEELNAAIRAKENALVKQEELSAKWKKEYNQRKQLFNTVQELRGNIRVFCRVRPPKSAAGPIATVFPDAEDNEHSLIEVDEKTFEYSHVFDPDASQAAVYEETSGVVGSVLDGYNVCIFAYGQTGSGKTHTMNGPKDDPGVNYRALQDLFRIAEERGEFFELKCTVSMLEVYNETLRDLLYEKKKHGGKAQPTLKIQQDPTAKKTKLSVHVPNLTETVCDSVDSVWNVMMRGSKNRALASTNMNEHSSRSHLILRVKVEMLNRENSKGTKGILTLVDLAGSERVGRSGAAGQQLREASAINKSLSALGDVFMALEKKQNHVPYRSSKLTYVLQDSIGGDSKTCMFVNVSADESDKAETISSLMFAERVARIQLGIAQKHVETNNSNSGGSKRATKLLEAKEEEISEIRREAASALREVKKKDKKLDELHAKLSAAEEQLKEHESAIKVSRKKIGSEKNDLETKIQALKKNEEEMDTTMKINRLKAEKALSKKDDEIKRLKSVLDEKEKELTSAKERLISGSKEASAKGEASASTSTTRASRPASIERTMPRANTMRATRPARRISPGPGNEASSSSKGSGSVPRSSTLKPSRASRKASPPENSTGARASSRKAPSPPTRVPKAPGGSERIKPWNNPPPSVTNPLPARSRSPSPPNNNNNTGLSSRRPTSMKERSKAWQNPPKKVPRANTFATTPRSRTRNTDTNEPSADVSASSSARTPGTSTFVARRATKTGTRSNNVSSSTTRGSNIRVTSSGSSSTTPRSRIGTVPASSSSSTPKSRTASRTGAAGPTSSAGGRRPTKQRKKISTPSPSNHEAEYANNNNNMDDLTLPAAAKLIESDGDDSEPHELA